VGNVKEKVAAAVRKGNTGRQVPGDFSVFAGRKLVKGFKNRGFATKPRWATALSCEKEGFKFAKYSGNIHPNVCGK
jgi:hypothetical protein